MDENYLVRGNYRMPRFFMFGDWHVGGPLEYKSPDGSWSQVTEATAPLGYDPRQDANVQGSNERLRFDQAFRSAPMGTPIEQMQQWAMDRGWQEPDRSQGAMTLGNLFSDIAPYALAMYGGINALGALGSLGAGAGAGAADLAAAEFGGGGIDALGAFEGAGAADAGLFGLESGGAGVGAADLGVGYGTGAGAGAAGGSAMDFDWLNSFNETADLSSLFSGESAAQLAADEFGGGGLLSLGNNEASASWLDTLIAQAKENPLGTAANTLKALGGTGSTIAGIPTSLLAGGANALGGYLSGQAAKEAAQAQANAQIEAAKIAAEAAKFKPIGVTTRFGSSNFQKDAQGNVIGAGYNLSPEMKAQQDALMGVSNQALQQYQGAQGMFAPMGQAGQRAMSLGNQYLAADPQAQALKYMQDQQALLATGRTRDLNNLLTGEFNRGTYGLATGGTGQMGAANPRLEALLNAQRQQDLGLAAQATQGGMDYAKFGTALSGLGGDLAKGMFSGQTAAYAPYQTALQGSQYIEGLGQQPLTMGIDMGKQMSNASAGGLLAQGMTNAANTIGNTAQTVGSQWGNLLTGAANSMQNYQQQQQQQAINEMLMSKLWGT